MLSRAIWGGGEFEFKFGLCNDLRDQSMRKSTFCSSQREICYPFPEPAGIDWWAWVGLGSGILIPYVLKFRIRCARISRRLLLLRYCAPNALNIKVRGFLNQSFHPFAVDESLPGYSRKYETLTFHCVASTDHWVDC